MSLKVVLVPIPESSRVVAQIWAGDDLVAEVCHDGQSGANGIVLDVHLPDATKPRKFTRDDLTSAIKEAASQLTIAKRASTAGTS